MSQLESWELRSSSVGRRNHPRGFAASLIASIAEDSTISVAFGRAFVKKACVAKRRLSDQGPTHRSAGKVVKHKVFNRYKLNETSRDLDEYIREVKGLNGI